MSRSRIFFKCIFVAGVSFSFQVWACPEFGTELHIMGKPLIPDMTTQVFANGGAKFVISMKAITPDAKDRSDVYRFEFDKNTQKWKMRGDEGGNQVQRELTNGSSLGFKVDERLDTTRACLFMRQKMLFVYTAKSTLGFVGGCPKNEADASRLSQNVTMLAPKDLQIKGSQSFNVISYELVKDGTAKEQKNIGILAVNGNTNLIARGVRVRSAGPKANFQGPTSQFIQQNCGGAEPGVEGEGSTDEYSPPPPKNSKH